MASKKSEGIANTIFGKILDSVSGGIRSFAAFLFFWMALGMMIGMAIVTYKPSLAIPVLIALAIGGLIAYYNTAFALIVLVLFILIFVPL